MLDISYLIETQFRFLLLKIRRFIPYYFKVLEFELFVVIWLRAIFNFLNKLVGLGKYGHAFDKILRNRTFTFVLGILIYLFRYLVLIHTIFVRPTNYVSIFIICIDLCWFFNISQAYSLLEFRILIYHHIGMILIYFSIKISTKLKIFVIFLKRIVQI